jgi:hypothetical protein
MYSPVNGDILFTDDAATGFGNLLLGPTAGTDIAPSDVSVLAGNAWAEASSNQAGADLNLCSGIGTRQITIVDYTGLQDVTVSLTIDSGTPDDLVEEVDWFAATSNTATATSLASAIDALAGVSASATGAVVYITPDVGTSTVVLASTDEVDLTLTQGTDGSIFFNGAALEAGISGPVSSTNNAIPRWDGTGGDTLQNSGVTIYDNDTLAIPAGKTVYFGNGVNMGAVAGGDAILTDANGTSFGKLHLGPSTSSFPMFQRNGGNVDLRLGDNSAYTKLRCASPTTDDEAATKKYVDDNAVPEPFTPSTDPWVVNGRISSPHTGTNSERFGAGSLAAANYASAFGNTANANGAYSVAIGYQSTTALTGGVAIGYSTIAQAAAVALGYDAEAQWNGAIAIGNASRALNTQAVAVGDQAVAGGASGQTIAVSVGYLAKALKIGSIALGALAVVNNTGGICLGRESDCNYDNAVAIGYDASATAASRCTIGKITTRPMDLQIAGDQFFFGADTSSNPSLKASGAELHVRLGDDSDYANLDCEELTAHAGLGVFGTTPPGTQPSAIADVTGTADGTYDTTEQNMLNDLKAQLNSALAALRGAGIIAT